MEITTGMHVWFAIWTLLAFVVAMTWIRSKYPAPQCRLSIGEVEFEADTPEAVDKLMEAAGRVSRLDRFGMSGGATKQ